MPIPRHRTGHGGAPCFFLSTTAADDLTSRLQGVLAPKAPDDGVAETGPANPRRCSASGRDTGSGQLSGPFPRVISLQVLSSHLSIDMTKGIDLTILARVVRSQRCQPQEGDHPFPSAGVSDAE